MMESVLQLYTYPFSLRPLQERVRIIKKGPPRPSFNIYFMPKNCAYSTSAIPIRYEEFAYSQRPWMCGCSYQKSFYCWYCILFDENYILRKRDLMWGRFAIRYSSSAFHVLLEVLRNHEMTFEHIQAEMNLKVFSAEFTKPPNIKLGISKGTDMTQRSVLKRLIDVVCQYIAQEQPPCYEDKFCRQLNAEDCVNILQLHRNYDTVKFKEIVTCLQLLTRTPKIVSNLVDALTGAIKLAVRRETQMSTFVSLILSSHSETEDKLIISTVVRYIRNGRVYERFVGFTNISNNITPQRVFMHIKQVLHGFCISERFLAYSVDGGLLPLSGLLDLIDLVKKYYPVTVFVPWTSYRPDYVFQQSWSYIKQCKQFFKSLRSLADYFNKNSERYKSLNRFMCKKNPSLKNSKWFVRSQIIKVLKTHRNNFIEFFDSLVNNSRNWDADVIVKAKGFHYFLQEFEVVFLLEIYSSILDHMDPLITLLNSNRPENVFDIRLVETLLTKLSTDQNTKFYTIWEAALESVEDSSFLTKVQQDVDQYRSVFSDIISHTIKEIGIRFVGLFKLEFCHMLLNESDKYILKDPVNIYTSQLSSTYENYYSRIQVKREVSVLHTLANVPKGSIEELYDFFRTMKMKDTLPSLFKVIELTLTLPIKRASSGKGSSKHKKISKWSRFPEDVPTPSPCAGDKGIICVEQNFLKELKKTEIFYDEVMSLLKAANGSIELT